MSSAISYILVASHLTKDGALVPDGKPRSQITESWEDFTARCLRPPQRTNDKAEILLFVPGPLIDAPVPNERGSTVLNDNIKAVHFLVFDIEGGGTPKTPAPHINDDDLAALRAHLKSRPFETLFFNSYSDGLPGKGRRGRILVPITEPIDPLAYGQTRQNQGSWWHNVFRTLAKHVLGPWYDHAGIVAGLESAKDLRRAYYGRSSPFPEAGGAEPWVDHNNSGVLLDATPYVASASNPSKATVETADKPAIGLNIDEGALKKKVRAWAESSSVAKREAAQAMRLVFKGEKWSPDGQGHLVRISLCYQLAQAFRPFDPKVVASQYFSASCAAWGNAERELGLVEEALSSALRKIESEEREKDQQKAEEAGSWRGQLQYTQNGVLKACTSNLLLVLKNHPSWVDVLGFDERAQDCYFLKEPPVAECAKEAYPATVDEVDCTYITLWFAKEMDLVVGQNQIAEVMIGAAMLGRVYDPVKDYFESVEWDGRERVESWLIDIAGAEDCTYTRAVSLCWLVSAVARTYEPGCKADHVLVLEGCQGIGKSTIFRTLCADPNWFTDHLPDLHNKDSFLQLTGKLIIEIGELNTISRATSSQVKNYLSSAIDTYRPPYGRKTQNVPRRSVFGASTNEHQYTADPTGARRFWPIRIDTTSINIAALKEMRDQLWAEAVHLYKVGVKWWLADRELEALAAQAQEERRLDEPFEELLDEVIDVAEHVELPETFDAQFAGLGNKLRIYHRLTVHDRGGSPTYTDGYILRQDVYTALGLKPEDKVPTTTRRIAAAMQAIGWVNGPRLQIADKRPRTFKPSPAKSRQMLTSWTLKHQRFPNSSH